MSFNFTTAQEQDAEKSKIKHERTRKLTDDRKPKYGDNSLAQTDGLKVIRTGKRRSNTVFIDDEVIDLRRVRTISDIPSYDD